MKYIMDREMRPMEEQEEEEEDGNIAGEEMDRGDEGHGMSSGRGVQQTAGGVIVTLVAIIAAVVAQNVSEVTSQPPVVIQGPKPHILYNSGQELYLPCVGTGQPQPRYEWYRDGVLIPEDQWKARADSDSGGLMLRTGQGQGRASDAGRYQCRVVNQFGVGMSNLTFLQEAALFPHAGRRVARNITATAGDSVTLPCNHTRLSIPDAHFQWFVSSCVRSCHDKRRVILTDRITMDENGNLVFGHVEESDGRGEQIYKCEADNPYRRSSYFGSPTRLIVKPNQHQNRTTVPKLKFASQSPVVALVGQNITLDCFYIGWPIPHVSWTIQSALYDPDRIIRAPPSHKLEILNVRHTDAGDYHCEGRVDDLDLRGDRTTIRLLVEEKPAIKQVPLSVNATEYDDVTFTCGATGSPAPSIEWYINEFTLHESKEMLRWELKDDDSTLTIYRVTMADRFTVHCNASNVHGYELRGAYLNVIERPPTPETTAGPTTSLPETTQAPPVEIITTQEKIISTVKIKSSAAPTKSPPARRNESNVLLFTPSTPRAKKTTPSSVPPHKNGSVLPQKGEDEVKQAYEHEGTVGLKSAVAIYLVLAMLCLLPILLIVGLVFWKNRSHTYNVDRHENCVDSSLSNREEEQQLNPHMRQSSEESLDERPLEHGETAV